MRELIRDWRGTAGCVILTWSLALVGLWIRSERDVDYITIRPTSHQALTIGSCRQGIYVSRQLTFEGPLIIAAFQWFHIGSEPWTGTEFETDQRFERWRCEWIGCLFKSLLYDDSKYPLEIQVSIWPHWILEIPLTLLSAWLLLSKPRPRQNLSFIQPTSFTVTGTESVR